MSIDSHCRHRGKDENDAPLLLQLEAAAEEADVVIGGKQGDQAEGQAAEGLDPAEAIETGADLGGWNRFWRNRRGWVVIG